MSQLKFKRNTRSTAKNLSPERQAIINPNKNNQRQPPQTKNYAKKRPPNQVSLLGMGFGQKNPEPIPEEKEILTSIKELLKGVLIETLLQNCPKLQMLVIKLCSKAIISKQLVIRCLDKYFHGNTTSLWEKKYAPQATDDIFQNEFAEKVEEWVKDFYYFRNQHDPIDSSFGFIDDNGESDFYSESLQARMRQYGWNCRAIVLAGREGMGKSSLLSSISKSLKMRSFQFSSIFDQHQKMKELEDGSKSQVVTNMNVNKKKDQEDSRLIMGNQSIASFMLGPKVERDTTLETKQPKRMQIFRNFSLYFPPYERSLKQGAQEGYFRYLFDKIEKSAFPYALTTNQLDLVFRDKFLNSKFNSFDLIEFIEPTVEDLTLFFWTVWHIEKHLCLDIHCKIKKEYLFVELNRQLQSIDLESEFESQERLRQVVTIANKKFHYIYKYLQFRLMPLERRKTQVESMQSSESLACKEEAVNIANIEEGKGALVDGKQLCQQNANQVISLSFEKLLDELGFQVLEHAKPDDLINNIDWNYFATPLHENPLEQTATDSNTDSAVKVEKMVKKESVKKMREKLTLASIQDRRIFQNEYYHHFRHEIAEEKDGVKRIQPQTHVSAKKKITKKMRKNFINYTDGSNCKTNYNPILSKVAQNPNTLFYLPMAFPSRRGRNMRKMGKQKVEEQLQKLMQQRQVAYIKKFSKFVMPE